MSRPKKRNGDRYTMPKPKAAAPVPMPLSDEERETQEFWRNMRRQEQDLRSRCNALLHPDVPSNDEWRDADLQGMNGEDASDEELIAYWRVHRAAMEIEDLSELPNLRQVTDYINSGRDPVQAFRKEYAELMAEE